MPAAKSKATKETTSDPNRVYNTGEIVLGKIKGYPAWPGQILEHNKAPPKVQKEKPKTKNIHLVQFFPTAEYGWIASRDLSLLTPKEITTYVSAGSKKKGALLEGYKIAQDPQEWNQQKADEAAEYEELLAQAGEGEDQLASEGEDGGKKKRKRQSEGGKKDEKKGKKAKAEKSNGKKVKKAKAEKSNGKKASKKDDDDEPATKKSKSSGSDDSAAETVKSWRHKLQKVFLGKGDISADEIPKCAEYFDAMEAFDMKTEYLTESKVHKVLKRIATLADNQIPDEDKHSFRPRSKELYTKWEALLSGGEAAATTGEAAPATEDDKPASNGAAADESKENGDPKAEESSEDKAEAKEGAEEEKKDEEMEVDASDEVKENGDKTDVAAAEDTKEEDKVAESS